VHIKLLGKNIIERYIKSTFVNWNKKMKRDENILIFFDIYWINSNSFWSSLEFDS